MLTVHPLAPIFSPGWCLGKDGDGESSGLKQLAAAEARPLLYERLFFFVPQLGSTRRSPWLGPRRRGSDGVRLGELEEGSDTMPPLRFFTHGC